MRSNNSSDGCREHPQNDNPAHFSGKGQSGTTDPTELRVSWCQLNHRRIIRGSPRLGKGHVPAAASADGTPSEGCSPLKGDRSLAVLDRPPPTHPLTPPPPHPPVIAVVKALL